MPPEMLATLCPVVAFSAFTSTVASAADGDAVFYRALNLNGPALSIGGHDWESGAGARDFEARGKTFDNQNVPLVPKTGLNRSRMIRSSVWGGDVELTLKRVPAGKFQVFLYVWEDNRSETFNLLVNDRLIQPGVRSGGAGEWKKLGPWHCESRDGQLKISARAESSGNGAANLSGLEIWSGDGPVPAEPAPAFADNPTPEQLAFFESKVRPLLVANCYDCHSAESGKTKNSLSVDSRESIRHGGDSGPALVSGAPDESLLIAAVRHTNPELTMPPRKKLPPEDIAVLEEWVKMGAPDPRVGGPSAAPAARAPVDWEKARAWWSFQPLTKPAPPVVRDTAWPENGIDSFILSRLETEGLAPAEDAAPGVLIRRLTYDLTGLPPSPEEVDAFEKSAAASGLTAAIREAAGRLLASPAYGETWGRRWLDVVRYADTAGDNSDFPIPQMRLYRDWVISAFNRDLPYNEFVREQLAGDLLPQRTNDQLIATGYLANARRFGSRVDDYPTHLTIEDTIDNFGRTFLGLTINCARCHDHKFDPIAAADYYALYGIFNSTRYPWPGIELEQRQRDLVPLVPEDQVAAVLAAERQRSDELERLKKNEKKLAEAAKKASDGPEKEDANQKLEAARQAVREAAVRPQAPQAYAVAESEKPADVPIQLRGDPTKSGPMVRRHFLTILGGAELPPDDHSSGRGKLAEWVLAPSNPLPARVMANRLWQGHFGKGLVATPNDFGKQGRAPTHPELLDWLASEFVSKGWSVKEMHRLIVTSRTYRQSSTPRSPEAHEKDPGQALLSSFPRLRLSAEAIRDTLLELGGSLDRAPGGEHPFPPQEKWEYTQHNPFKAVYPTNKRSVYLMTQRIQRHPFLAIFDGADPSTSTAQRTTSTTPLQALFLLNDPLVHEQAAKFADRLRTSLPAEPDRFHAAWLELFARPPGPEEVESAQAFLSGLRSKLAATGQPPEAVESEAWHALIRALLRLNEFVYLD